MIFSCVIFLFFKPLKIFRLSLHEDSTNRVSQLAFPDLGSDEKSDVDEIDFEQFCDCFVSALSEISDNNDGFDTATEDPEERLDDNPVEGKM